MKSLRTATTSKKICALERDNFHVGPGQRWSLFADEVNVYLGEQEIGAAPTQRFSIPRNEFNRLIDAYMREQNTNS